MLIGVTMIADGAGSVYSSGIYASRRVGAGPVPVFGSVGKSSVAAQLMPPTASWSDWRIAVIRRRTLNLAN
jgi:hypothetical protein